MAGAFFEAVLIRKQMSKTNNQTLHLDYEITQHQKDGESQRQADFRIVT